MLSGEGANLFAESIGVSTVPTDSLVTEYEKREWEKHKRYMTGVMEDFNSQWYEACAISDVMFCMNQLMNVS